jgi:F-type H+-transporting ATPase subunit a
MFPYAFTVTAQIVVTFALAALVFALVTLYGIVRNGFGFFRLFMPAGVPMVLAPIIVPIEVISYISRPVSHSVRLFAVMLAGHITLKVFAGFVVSLGGFGVLGMVGAVLPLFMTVAITALEFMMAGIQAYVFTMLTCMYLNDALHPGH